jgi:hypothetical protein
VRRHGEGRGQDGHHRKSSHHGGNVADEPARALLQLAS